VAKKKKVTNSPVHVRTPQEVWRELLEQFQALKDMGALYDSGKTFYAKHLAGIVYTLLKDSPAGGNNNPILEQLNLRGQLNYLSTAIPRPPAKRFIFPKGALIAYEFGTGYVPLCKGFQDGMNRKLLPFQQWWDEIILDDDNGHELTRHLLVNRLRSKDGGAHYDASIDDPAYQSFKKTADPDFLHTIGAGPATVVPEAHLPSMRQIAWELQQTLAPVIASGLPQPPPSTP
jgi:hypothetical protein